jgi:hypothetical protein
VREDRSRACSREQSFATHSNASIGLRPNRAGSETVESTLILRKPSPFAGRRRKRIFGRFTRDREESPAPRKHGIGDPGARGTFEEGRPSF